MKRIIFEKFILIPAEDGDGRFDLSIKVQRTKKGATESYEAEKILAYGVSLDRAAEYMCNINILNGEGELTLKEYVEEHRKQLIEIKNLLTA